VVTVATCTSRSLPAVEFIGCARAYRSRFEGADAIAIRVIPETS
jgi:hypothetical protein